MTKKRSSEIFGIKIEHFFLKKVIEKFRSAKICIRPLQTRRQVSAYGL